MTQQGSLQAAFREISGTAGTFQEDVIEACNVRVSRKARTYNEALLTLANNLLNASHTNINEALAGLAANQGAHNWSGLGSLPGEIPISGEAANVWFAENGGTDPLAPPVFGSTAFYDATGNKTWIAYEGFAAVERRVMVKVYDHATETATEYEVSRDTLTDDGHGRPTLCMDDNGFVHIFFGSHNSVQKYATTDTARDPSAWTQQSDISGNHTYPHPVLVGSDIWLFTRIRNVGDNDYNLFVTKGTITDGVASWGTAIELVDVVGSGKRFYAGDCLADGTDVHIIGCLHNTNGDRVNVYHLVYDTTDGSLENTDASTDTASGSLPVNLTVLSSSYRVFQHSGNYGNVPSMQFDDNGNIHVVFADSADDAAFDIKHIWTPKGEDSWSTPVDIGLDSDNQFQMAVLAPVSGGTMDCYIAEDTDDEYTGRGGDVYRARFNGTSWGAKYRVLTAGTYPSAQAASVLGAHADLRVLFGDRINSENDVDHGNTRIYAYGDNGFIGDTGTLVDEHWYDTILQVDFTGTNGQTTATDESLAETTVTFNADADIQDNYVDLDGTGDYVLFGRENFQHLPGDFTVEMGVKIPASLGTSDTKAFLTLYTSLDNSRSWRLFWAGPAEVLRFAISTTGENFVNIGDNLESSWAYSLDTHYDIAVERSGNTWRLYIDGVVVDTETDTATIFEPLSGIQMALGALDIGEAEQDETQLQCNYLRITTAARYEGAHTPPTTPLPDGGLS